MCGGCVCACGGLVTLGSFSSFLFQLVAIHMFFHVYCYLFCRRCTV